MTKAALARKDDIERVCKAVVDAGLPVRKLFVRDGEIEVIIGEGNEPDDPLEAERARDKLAVKAKIHGKA